MLTDFKLKVIFSEKAFLGIAAETYESSKAETGGIFLGIRTFYQWYILETLDPGLNPIFRPGYFDYDTAYINHLSRKIARFYQEPIELLGLWHRHPGSFDYFSLTDDRINEKYASQHSEGIISALVNLDPFFRLTMYHVSLPSQSQLRPQYTKIFIEVGDKFIPQQLLTIKPVSHYLETIND
ncbi:hypothetical protein PCC7424_5395 (plasmid) [Gloeothece citriformis PCC 7424]|uniref:JAB domain-containing protein n=1 Tax=Gloeothece citriformis (strain PCC 7424) TaxID=65393 RepID=B7KMF1_GLOC7|nr:Mov34/MPN/PAD-1 family protein [Gloeothece citriformis]ACK73973.1 hypothetical protein PCC7424_5395 [Gloeothece citriformis PCC 7424]